VSSLYFRLLVAGLTSGALLSGCQPASPVRVTAPIVIRWARDPDSLDPLARSNSTALEALSLLHASLLQVNPVTWQTEPLLAQALPTSVPHGDSTCRITYQIRPQARWDTGRPVLATDVAFTLKLLYCPALPNETLRLALRFIRAIELDPHDARRFTLVCTGSGAALLLASGDYAILPEFALDPRGELRPYSLAQVAHPAPPVQAALRGLTQRYQAAAPARHPQHLPGCGPYQLASWQTDRQLRFTRKPRWWGDSVAGQPLLLQALPRELRFVIMPTEAAAVLSLRRGELDVLPNASAQACRRLRQSPGAARLTCSSALSWNVVVASLNTRHLPLVSTRWALAYLLDAARLCQASQLGSGRLTVGLISPADSLDYNRSLPLLAYDPAKAVALLHQAGWRRTPAGWRDGQGKLRKLVVRYGAGEATYELVALQLRAAATQVGLGVELRPTTPALLSQVVTQGKYDVYLHTMRGNPFRFDFTALYTKAGFNAGNITHFSTPGSDRLLTALARAPTLAAQRRLVHAFQVVMRQHMPIIPLFFVANRVIAQRRIQGLQVSSLRPGYLPTCLVRAPQ
jgi:ABC-type transport system substrate-binding protein